MYIITSKILREVSAQAGGRVLGGRAKKTKNYHIKKTKKSDEKQYSYTRISPKLGTNRTVRLRSLGSLAIQAILPGGTLTTKSD
jgi:hypothetical protein